MSAGPPADLRAVPAGPRYAPALTANGERNRALLADLLAGGDPGELRLPPGRFPLAGGLVIGAGWTLRGAGAPPGARSELASPAAPAKPAPPGARSELASPAAPARLALPGAVNATPGTWLYADRPGGGEPLLHVVGAGVRLIGLCLEPAPSDPGPHGGDRGTAVTVGRYLYPQAPEWIYAVGLTGLRVRATSRGANAVAVMGAVRDVAVDGLTVDGGCTGLAVHWGARGRDVTRLSGPTYHPHGLSVTGLRVRAAFEGFYLSAVHDVRVDGADLRGVEVGFRLLAGDNTDRFYPRDGVVGRRIAISRVAVTWRGRLYGMRVAGWGRSEVDGAVTTLAYEDVEVCDCRFVALEDRAAPPRSRAPIVLERAHGVMLRGISIEVG